MHYMRIKPMILAWLSLYALQICFKSPLIDSLYIVKYNFYNVIHRYANKYDFSTAIYIKQNFTLSVLNSVSS